MAEASASASAPTRLVLIRHGESNATVTGVVGGHSGCTGLTPLGRRQAEALRDRLEATGELGPVAALFASVLPRAVETASIIAPALGVAESAVTQECDLCELHAGSADGLRWADVALDFDPFSASGVYRPWAEGAESWAEFSARVGRALHSLASRFSGSTVVVACHGGIVENSFSAFGGVPVRRGFSLRTENTSLTEWMLPAGQRQWRLVRYNDAAHLAGLAAADG